MQALSSFLLYRLRVAVLSTLLAVLLLQSGTQLLSGLQVQRHLHTQSGTAGAVPSRVSAGESTAFSRLLRAMLDRMHAAHTHGSAAGPQIAAGDRAANALHAHGGLVHRHDDQTQDVVELDAGNDEPLSASAAPFLAWLPQPLRALPRIQAERPVFLLVNWQDQVVAPARVPPRS